jgi:hypothetical protein
MWSATAHIEEGELSIVRSREKLIAIQVGNDTCQVAILYREDGSIEQVMVPVGTKVAEVKLRHRVAEVTAEWKAIHEPTGS